MNTKRNAFTLVELLVVIGIITVLLGILVPSLGKVRQIARRTMCKAQLHSVAQAFRMYLDDNRNTMPPAAAMPWKPDNPNELMSEKLPIITYLGQYLSVPIAELADTNKKCYAKVLCCPADKKNGDPKHYFRIQQSSYAYNEWRGNRSMNRASFTKNAPERDVEIMWDFETFHGTAGKPGAKNYLFSDCHVGNINGD
jgi:prepilin-type N-terminal cleavage/methylation domain-containing protein